jgi:hypothetical protein
MNLVGILLKRPLLSLAVVAMVGCNAPRSPHAVDRAAALPSSETPPTPPSAVASTAAPESTSPRLATQICHTETLHTPGGQALTPQQLVGRLVPVSASVKATTFVLNSCQEKGSRCRPVLQVPVVEDDPVSQAHLDTAWRRLAGMDEEHQCWLHSLTFVINYDAHGLLSVTFWCEVVGAHISTVRRTVNLKRHAGVLTGQEFLRKSAVPQVVAMLTEQLRQNVAKAREYVHAHEPDEADSFDLAIPADPHFTTADLERFALHRDGIRYDYEFDFPHVIRALAPGGPFVLSQDQLRPHLDPDGPLRHWVRPSP